VNNASNRFEEHGTQIGRVGLTGATRGALGRAVGRYAISAIAVIASATTLISLAEGQGAFSFEVGLAAAWWLFWLLVLPGVPLFLVLILLLPRLEHWLPNTRVELLATAASFVIWLLAAAVLVSGIWIATPSGPGAPTISGALIVLLGAGTLGAIVGFVEGFARGRAAGRAA
jgi:hypothetical protein